jgi:type II secretory pathway pseudopilin PulG
MKRRSSAGFSLVELAIALSVAALLLGGVILAGNSMLQRSNTTSLIAKIKDLAAASREFKSKYGYLPGDLPGAGTYITAGGGILSGCIYDPDGIVGNGLVDTETESGCALEHLSKSGLVSKIQMDSAGAYVLPSGFEDGRVSLWYFSSTSENAVRVTKLPCSTALEIDRKVDNDSTTPLLMGSVQGLDASATAITTCSVGATNDPVATLLIRY